MSGSERVIVIGAGIGGLSAALTLTAAGIPVAVYEKAQSPGGKMREITIKGMAIDSGPTVLTWRQIFDELAQGVGADLNAHVALIPLSNLAAHVWPDGSRFDLPADARAAVDAVGDFAGAAEAARFRQFQVDTARLVRTLDQSFMRASRPNPLSLAHRIGWHRPDALLALKPFTPMWRALGQYFHDPRLRQLFARYATYTGASPFAAPATLMLIAHVESEGVWAVRGGLQRLADALKSMGEKAGATFHMGEEVSSIEVENGRAAAIRLASGMRVPASAIISNAAFEALGTGLLKGDHASRLRRKGTRTPSLSAITWSMLAKATGHPLAYHNVVFSSDYRAEFDSLITRRSLAREPTLYLCAQDRLPGADLPGETERVFMLMNAPPVMDTERWDHERWGPEEAESWLTKNLKQCASLGLTLTPTAPPVMTTPADFARLFPATRGALYGLANHGWRAPFQRPSARTPIPGLYQAGGGAHPGPGVPMAAISGRLAAQALIADRPSISRSRPAAIFGGISTPKATTKPTR